MHRLLQKVLIVALALAPFGAAHAHADVGTVVPNLELRTAAGGKEKLFACTITGTIFAKK